MCGFKNASDLWKYVSTYRTILGQHESIKLWYRANKKVMKMLQPKQVNLSCFLLVSPSLNLILFDF